MKKIFPAAIIAISTVIMFSSCNKSYTCTCTVTSAGDTHVISTGVGTTTKNNAQSKCNAIQANYAGPASSVTAACHI